MDLPEAADRRALKGSSSSAKHGALTRSTAPKPPRLLSLQPGSCLAERTRRDKPAGWSRWQGDTGVLTSSMPFRTGFNPAFFIPVVQSRGLYAPKKPQMCELGFWFFWVFFLKQKGSEILLSLCNCRGEISNPPNHASSHSSAAFCFIMLILLFLRQITCNPHKN